MAGKTIFFILAIIAEIAQSDKCTEASSYSSYKQKTSVTGLKCTGAIASNTCGSTCCDKITTKCEHTTGTCASGTYKDSSKGGNTAGSDFKANCCTTKKTCDLTCTTAGLKDKANKATIKCSGGTCSPTECCESDTTKCRGIAAVCDTDKYKDSSKYDVAATSGTFKANCCTAKKTCDVTCPAGMKDKANKATIKCSSGTCSSSECCDADTTKCLGATGTCTASTHFKDAAKYGTLAGSAFATNCCTARPSCQSWFDTSSGTASSSIKNAPSVFLSIIGALILSKLN